MKALFHKILSEAVAVGRASGDLPADYADEQMKTAQGFPASMRASVANDLANGNQLELDWLAGKIVELGHASSASRPPKRSDLRSAQVSPHGATG